MRIYFSGAEHPTWRKKLVAWDVKHLAINFKHLLPRLPKKGPFLIAERFPEDTHVITYFEVPDDAPETVEQYLLFVDKNAERLDFAIEPNGVPDRLEIIRATSPCIPMWRSDDGPRALQRLADQYSGVAVPQSAWNSDRPVSGRLNRLSQGGTSLHGLGVSKREVLEATAFSSVSTGSWLSVSRNGETQLWDGSELRRFPATDKSSRERYRGNIARAGFDPEAVAKGDRDTLSQLAVWSWQQYEERLSRRREMPDDAPMAKLGQTNATSAASPETQRRGDAGGQLPTTRATNAGPTRERVTLPILAMHEHEVTGTDGEKRNLPLLHVSSGGVRKCDDCQLSEVCPSYSAGETCAFDIPVQIRTKDQYLAVLSSLLEVQSQRVFLARFREELEGSVDKALSDEMDRMFRMAAQYQDIADAPETFKLQMEARGGAGVLSRLFGSQVGEAVRALPGGGLDERETTQMITSVMDVDPELGADNYGDDEYAEVVVTP